MQARWVVPMIDFVFLSLGGLMAAMTQMEVFKSIPLKLAEANSRASAPSSDAERDVVSISDAGLALNDEPIELGALGPGITRPAVVVRADGDVAHRRVVEVLAEIRTAAPEAAVSLQFAALAESAHGGVP